MNIELVRDGSIEGVGTTGNVICGDFMFASIEQDWQGNRGFVSCVPLGTYQLVPYSSEKYPDHYALVNKELGVYAKESDIPKGQKGRYAILIHVANTASQLQGCIAVGMSRGYVTPKGHNIGLGVLSSTNAFNILSGMLDQDEENSITITDSILTW